MGCIFSRRATKNVQQKKIHHRRDVNPREQAVISMMKSDDSRLTNTIYNESESFLTKLFRGRRGLKPIKIEASNRNPTRRTANDRLELTKVDTRRSKVDGIEKPFGILEVKKFDRKSDVKSPDVNLLLQIPIQTRKRKSIKDSSIKPVKMHAPEVYDTGSLSDPYLPQPFQGESKHHNIEPCFREDASTCSSNLNAQESTLVTQHGSEDGTILFVSVESLCKDVIKKMFLQNFEPHSRVESKVLCLFMFGCPGSAKGEVAFELVEHSSLIQILEDELCFKKFNEISDKCPIYHHIDVAGIIAANIDSRIRAYNQLVAQAARVRREQIALWECAAEERSSSSSLNGRENKGNISNNSQDSQQDGIDEENVSGQTNFSEVMNNDNDSDRRSVSSVNSCTTTSFNKLKKDESNLTTLSTKQRSILQLKLMKFSNSITSKWVYRLIQNEVERFEQQLQQRLTDSPINSENKPPINRVYLINLVPNQLSLFKSCLYLSQNLQQLISGFKYPYCAIKFERRTNIKLLTKDRSATDSHKSSNAKTSVRYPIKVTGLKFPRLSKVSSASSSPEPSFKSINRDKSDAANSVGVEASKVLANSINEKLGPKFNENFAQQFKNINKLVSVRYNPVRNYNYADEDFDDLASDLSIDPKSERSASCSGSFNNQLTLNKRHVQSVNEIDETESQKDHASAESLDEISQRLCLSRISQFESQSIVPRMSPSQASSYLSSTPSLLSSRTIGGSDTDIPTTRLNNDCSVLPFSKSLVVMSTPIKWAIELELFSSTGNTSSSDSEKGSKYTGFRWRSPSADNPKERQDSIDCQVQLALARFDEPRSLSRSPLIFSTHHQKRHASYHLIPVRVEYPSGNSQIQYEVKRAHQRLIKLKSHSDLECIVKLIKKAKNQVEADCQRWLNPLLQAKDGPVEQVLKQHVENHYQHNLGSQVRSTDQSNHGQNSDGGNHHSTLRDKSNLQQPVLVVYSICIDIYYLQSGKFQYPLRMENCPPNSLENALLDRTKVDFLATQQRPTSSLVPILMLNDSSEPDEKLLMPKMVSHHSKRPMSSRSANCVTRDSNIQPKRHVQFRLSQAPDVGSSMDPIKIERRLWLDDSIFVSSTDKRHAQTMKQLADMLRSSL